MIVGLSISTRQIGIAFLQNGELMDWGVKTFRGRWSEQRLRQILSYLKKLIDSHLGCCIAVKLPKESHREPELLEVMEGFKLVAAEAQIPVRLYDINDLKRQYCPTSNVKKRTMLRLLAEKYPYLARYHKKGAQNKHKYYIRIFEAVAAAEVCLTNEIPRIGNTCIEDYPPNVCGLSSIN